uniref:Uncharacterized protein n=1 Tax=Triticum urartu TaxID=4572 RepID=A0A8R7V8E6_TRIUA
MCLHYCNELDIMTPKQATWEPYGTAGNIGTGASYLTFTLNPKCLQEARPWRMYCPLICYCAVEFHQPQRVMT